MAVEDYGAARSHRWWIHRGRRQWMLFRPSSLMPCAVFPTFTEAHAAYLDAVTCDRRSTWLGPKYRCTRTRGHRGNFHTFKRT